MEKLRPWCGQPSDRERLKIRSENGFVSCPSQLATLRPLTSNRLRHTIHRRYRSRCSGTNRLPTYQTRGTNRHTVFYTTTIPRQLSISSSSSSSCSAENNRVLFLAKSVASNKAKSCRCSQHPRKLRFPRFRLRCNYVFVFFPERKNYNYTRLCLVPVVIVLQSLVHQRLVA